MDVWLWRSKDGAVVHTMECRHARKPWHWADGRTPAEVMWACQLNGISACKHCRPLG